MLDDDELEEGVTDDNYERTQFQNIFGRMRTILVSNKCL